MTKYYSDEDYYPSIIALKWDMMLGKKLYIQTKTIYNFIGRKIFWNKIECQDTTTETPTTEKPTTESPTTEKPTTEKPQENEIQPTCPLERNPVSYNNYGC
uniref:Uncharacterized protein n=1 Tax=Meloidogyne hapla TaxID=6305 RepID=A0A1I8BQ63_MELHA